MSYCTTASREPLNAAYHDTEYGFPVRDDIALFERLILEINQAGLSWTTVLRKRENFRRAFDGFNVTRVAAYARREKARLLRDDGIIRNVRKIDAAVENANRLLALKETHGSFASWLDSNHPLDIADWVRLFKRTFVFTGNEITREFLLSTGYLPGAHEQSCPAYRKILQANPPWARAKR